MDESGRDRDAVVPRPPRSPLVDLVPPVAVWLLVEALGIFCVLLGLVLALLLSR
jgi:hypothetical protein